MLQRAASNAYSWWWASHIRTKQSKWLEQNLQDMEDKVQYMLKLIEEDGDSFAKRAEMYYKKRPELIHFVEDSYRAYRALAERYDHISTELQNANNTIACVFPEQVQFAMEDDDETPSPKFPRKTSEGQKGNVPKVPKIPKEFKGMFGSATKKFQRKKSKDVTTATEAKAGKSGLSKDKGLQEIDKIQREILALQTEKEFVKSSYESGLAKYWEIEQQIEEMQEKISSLQDEFGSGIVIEDDEARTLMASAALKSCQDSLAQLQEKQETSAKEAAIEQERIKNAQEKLSSLKVEFSNGQVNEEKPQAKIESVSAAPEKSLEVQESTSQRQSQDLELIRKQIKEHFDVESCTSLTVTELAEKIDELVNKVFTLEAAVSSQTALIKRLRTETDDLQGQLQTLEDDKATLVSGKNVLSEKLRGIEEKLHGIQDLNQNVEDHNKNLQTHFTEAHLNLDHLSERLDSVKPDEELRATTETKKGQTVEANPQEGFKGIEGPPNHRDNHGDSENVKQGEETEDSNKMHIEFKEAIGAVNPGSFEEPQDVKQTEELKVAGEMQKDFKEKEGSLNLEGLQEPQNEKTDEESNISDSSLKEKELPTEVSVMQLSGEQEKPGHLDSSEQVADNKKGDGINEHEISSPNTKGSENVSQLHAVDDTLSGKSNVQTVEESKQASAKTVSEQVTKQDDEPDWKQLFMNGMENREQVLLKEYTTVLRNFKEVKKRLNDSENKPEKKTGGDSLFDVMVQLRELKSANAKKDEQIRILRQKLNLMNVGFGDQNEADKSMVSECSEVEKAVTDDLKKLLEEQDTTSPIEQKFRSDIDEVLEENLEFWLRFSGTFHEIQKFETGIKDLQSELLKLEEKKQDGSSTSKYSLKSDAKPLYKHLREIHTELSIWLEKSMLLKDELKSRFSSLCDIQEELTAALKESAEDEEFTFTSYQAAKFQGEILNMKQENNKVADELQAGLDHVTTLQLEVEKTLAKLNEEFKLSGSKNSHGSQLPHSDSRSRVPLRSFIFGIKPKRQKHSIFSCMHPALHKKYNGFKSSSNSNT